MTAPTLTDHADGFAVNGIHSKAIRDRLAEIRLVKVDPYCMKVYRGKRLVAWGVLDAFGWGVMARTGGAVQTVERVDSGIWSATATAEFVLWSLAAGRSDRAQSFNGPEAMSPLSDQSGGGV